MGHHSVRAATPVQIKQAQNGWKFALEDLSQAAPQINLNLSGLPATSLLINDSFSGNITLTNVINVMLANMDVEENVKVWFNNKVWPSYPIYLNALSNSLLRIVGKEIGINCSRFSKKSNDSDPVTLGILTINHPMNQTVNEALSGNAV